MSGVLGRTASPPVVRPVSPVTWRPATPAPLTPRRVVRLPGSGAQVIAIPVDVGRTRERTPVHASLPSPIADPQMRAPWGEPDVPFAGVTVTTSQVPRGWLRPPARSAMNATIIPIRPARTAPADPATSVATVARPPHAPATIIQLPHAPRTLPPPSAPLPVVGRRGRFRRGMALAVGLLVSLVAVEVAARSGRR